MPTTVILAINAGSSSVKASVYKSGNDGHNVTQLAEAQVTGITSPPATFKYTRGEEKIKDQEVKDVKDQGGAFEFILDQFMGDESLTELSRKEDIGYVCHRIVHGGDYRKVQIINRETFHHLQELTDLAPLHNSVALAIVREAHDNIPDAVNMAYFDSSFHATIPKHIYTYPLDQKTALHNKLRKYGFHGISYSYILRSVSAYLGKDPKNTNLIALHLGSGASACVIKNGQSLDTSMGLTPASGLPGSTRSGDIDPSLVFHYTHEAGSPSPSSTKELHITQAEEIINKKAGFKALTGTSDFGQISASDDEMCKLTVDLFVDRILNYVGSYYLKLGGKVDALVFAGGIGEKGVALRRRVVEACNCLGFDLDAKKNENPEDAKVADIGATNSKQRVLICQTDEQYEMAKGCVEEAQRASSQTTGQSYSLS